VQVVTGARTTKLATEKGSAGVRAVGVEYAVGGPSGSRQTGARIAAAAAAVVRAQCMIAKCYVCVWGGGVSTACAAAASHMCNAY
jgi:hypothetical protein